MRHLLTLVTERSQATLAVVKLSILSEDFFAIVGQAKLYSVLVFILVTLVTLVEELV